MMPAALRGKVKISSNKYDKHIFLNILSRDLLWTDGLLVAVLPLTRLLSSIGGGDGDRLLSTRGREERTNATQTAAAATASRSGADANKEDGRIISSYRDGGTPRQNPPDPIPNRPLRGERKKPVNQPEEERPLSLSRRKFDLGGGKGFDNVDSNDNPSGVKYSFAGVAAAQKGNKTTVQQSGGSNLFSLRKSGDENGKTSPLAGGEDFLEKFKLRGFEFDKGGRVEPLSKVAEPQLQKEGEEEETKDVQEAVAEPQPLPPPQDVDDIFKEMKENGLISNAVAMLDGLCKDGLVQEAMKLFGLMREKGTIPEVVIYTAVVEGFCKALKFDDAKRIFRKMQNNGISPNAFSYTVLIQGLYKGKRLDDALDFCVEMLEAGHSPNMATFTGLVEGFCRDKGLEEARSIIEMLRHKGFFLDDKAAREYLDKKGPFLPLVWEAILGKKKNSQRSF